MHNLPTPKTEAALQSPYERARAIQQALDRAARYLPTQGPIDVFVAQNILQGFEDEPFEEAVVHAARVYGTEPFLAESRYREELAVGRIRDADLVAVLEADLGPSGGELLAGGRVPLQTLLLELLRHPVRQEEDVAVRWTLTESDAVERPATADLDQGVAAWPMPGRERGFLVAIVDLYANRFGPTEPWPGWGRSFRSSALGCGGDIRLRGASRQEPAHFEPEVRKRGAVSRSVCAGEKNPALSVDRRLLGTSTIGPHQARPAPAVAPHDPPRSAHAYRSAVGRPILCDGVASYDKASRGDTIRTCDLYVPNVAL